MVDPVTGSMGYTYDTFGQRLTLTLPDGAIWNYTYAPTGVTGPHEVLPKDDPESLSLLLTNITDDQGRRLDLIYPTGPNGDSIAQYTFLTGRFIGLRTNQTFTNGGAQLVSYQESDYVNDSIGPHGNTHNWLNTLKTTFYSYNSTTQQWSSRVLGQNVYGYDTLGQRLSNQITDSTGASRTETYSYDPLNRLTAVNYGDGQTQGDPTNWQTNPGYTFDAMGNRLTKQDSVTGTENYGYNNANMLTGRNGTNNYTNDLDGNTLSGGGRTNTWDSENRLTQCVYTSNGNTTTTSQYTYGSDGLRRHATITSGSTTTSTDFVLDNSMFLREVRYNGATPYNYATYLMGPRGPEYRRDDVGGTIRWYVYDGLGSVLAEVDPNGNVTSSRKYDVYGGVRTSTGTSTSKHKFVGSLGHPSDDESGLIYMQARYMDPQTGRFLTEDPKQHNGNWFACCNDDPINRVDRNGQDDQTYYTLMWQAALYVVFGLVLMGMASLQIISGTLAAVGWDPSVVLGLADLGCSMCRNIAKVFTDFGEGMKELASDIRALQTYAGSLRGLTAIIGYAFVVQGFEYGVDAAFASGG